MSGRPCRKCGTALEFLENEHTHKPIPAHALRVVYERRGDKLRKLEVPSGAALYVSHFETCTHPSEFSRRASS